MNCKIYVVDFRRKKKVLEVMVSKKAPLTPELKEAIVDVAKNPTFVRMIVANYRKLFRS